MKLTKEEELLILKKRAKEEEETPKFTGKAKHDLYYLDSREPEISVNIENIIGEESWYFSEKVKNAIVDKVLSEMPIRKALSKGANFDCYIQNGQRLWFDSEGEGIEEYGDDWAIKNLENIRPYK
jgi:hypothetical protein